MIGYCCKYAPVELLEALGADPVPLNEAADDFETAGHLTHSSMCCRMKSVLQQGLHADELIFVDCCDSMRRCFDVLDGRHGSKFDYFLPLPHQNGACAVEQLQQALLDLLNTYRQFKGTVFQRELFLERCRAACGSRPKRPYLALMGARTPPGLTDAVRNHFSLPVADLTCGGQRNLEPPPGNAGQMTLEELMRWYAGALLHMMPCMRMTSHADRRALTEDPLLVGIVYHTVKFCDYYGFEYAQLKKQLSLPILKIESDYTNQAAGQLHTRLNAFAESLRLKSGAPAEAQTQEGLYAGIDSGSTTTSMVVIDQDGNILASSIVRTGAKAQNGAASALRAVCDSLRVAPEAFRAVMATGYGRSHIPFATGSKTEITCHARGAHFLDPTIRTIIDIGGQDSKVICLDETGGVRSFVMNDKCAAGTGRFLEMMARTLELELDEMSACGLHWEQDLTISSMCTVFAESEVISLIADNHSVEDIVHGLDKAIASKTVSMVRRSAGTGPFMMTGGVARNKGVVRELERRLQMNISIPGQPDLCGALGAALLARES